MRVLGIPSRVVTVFNAAHDGDASLKVEEYYSSTGEKLNLSKDSIWWVSPAPKPQRQKFLYLSVSDCNDDDVYIPAGTSTCGWSAG